MLFRFFFVVHTYSSLNDMLEDIHDYNSFIYCIVILKTFKNCSGEKKSIVLPINQKKAHQYKNLRLTMC
jgi:hypothetical protein